jgi:hypothetical protein
VSKLVQKKCYLRGVWCCLIAGFRLKSKLLGAHLNRQVHGRPVPPCFPATWKCWKELKTPFSQQPGISENCSKYPLGLCANLLLWMMFHPPNGGREAATEGHAESAGRGVGEREEEQLIPM